MNYTRAACLLALLVFVSTSNLVRAQDEFQGIGVGEGAVFSIGEGVIISVGGGDVYVSEGATLINEGELIIDRDLVVDGNLQTIIGGTSDNPTHGRIHVAGDAEYRGTLTVAQARGAYFSSPQDFTIATYAAGFGQLTASALPGARWTSTHYDEELVVSINGVGEDLATFGISIDAAPLDGKVLIDWVAQHDSRTKWYVVERYDQSSGWQFIGEVERLGQVSAASYYSTVDNDLPTNEELVRYRIKLEDENGTWNYSDEVLVGIDKEAAFRVFPNPVSGNQVRVLGMDYERGIEALHLVNAQGKVIKQFLLAQEAMHILELPDGLVAGTYVLQLIYKDGQQKSTKLVYITQP